MTHCRGGFRHGISKHCHLAVQQQHRQKMQFATTAKTANKCEENHVPLAGSGDGVSGTVIWLSRSGSRRLGTLPVAQITDLQLRDVRHYLQYGSDCSRVQLSCRGYHRLWLSALGPVEEATKHAAVAANLKKISAAAAEVCRHGRLQHDADTNSSSTLCFSLPLTLAF